MNRLEQSLFKIAIFLDDNIVPYMVIGGIANAVWGEPRATLDIDVTIWIENDKIPGFVDKVSQNFKILSRQPLDFIEKTNVLPLIDDDVRIDIIFGRLPFEKEAVRRAVTRKINDHDIRFISVEDLIIQKIISEREKDYSDAQKLVSKNKKIINKKYIEKRLKKLSELFNRLDILEDYHRWIKN
ncbi:MAG: nucleotidyltransferase [FCB group bacterium]|nr:nucleotidyltransferase [FCB group bacterium]